MSAKTYEGAAGKKVARLEESVAEDAYAALQQYKTFQARAAKKGDWPAAIDLCRSGAMTMLANKHLTAGTELALLLVETMETGQVEQCDELKDIVLKISDAFVVLENNNPQQQMEAAKNQGRFLKAAIHWSTLAKHGHFAKGDPDFHLLRAQAMQRRKDLPSASTNFLHAGKPQLFAQFLYDWSALGYQSERDMFLTRAVLQLLALENLKDANLLHEQFSKILAEKGTPLKNTPLANFTRFLLKTVERDAYPLYQVLVQKYAPSLNRDQSFIQYLDRIQEIYFGVKPQKRGMQAMLDNMLGMFGGAR